MTSTLASTIKTIIAMKEQRKGCITQCILLLYCSPAGHRVNLTRTVQAHQSKGTVNDKKMENLQRGAHACRQRFRVNSAQTGFSLPRPTAKNSLDWEREASSLMRTTFVKYFCRRNGQTVYTMSTHVRIMRIMMSMSITCTQRRMAARRHMHGYKDWVNGHKHCSLCIPVTCIFLMNSFVPCPSYTCGSLQSCTWCGLVSLCCLAEAPLLLCLLYLCQSFSVRGGQWAPLI